MTEVADQAVCVTDNGFPTQDLQRWIKPQLTKLLDAPPDGSDWLHEIKFDGYRLHARLDDGRVQLLTRTGLDWTHKYPAIAAAVSSLRAKQAYLDGELCGVRPDGTTSFSAIQNASDAGKSDALVFFLFDLLYLDGETVGSAPLIDRKARLQQLLANNTRPLSRCLCACWATRRFSTNLLQSSVTTSGKGYKTR
jgi:ATP-dependent DNA ligase